MSNGIYYFSQEGKVLPVIPSSMYSKLVSSVHIPPMSGHGGVKKTYELAK